MLKVGVKDVWQTMRILPDDATSVTIYKLQPGTLYQFMVLSRNRLGDGLFSKPVTLATKGRPTIKNLPHRSAESVTKRLLFRVCYLDSV